MTKPSDIDFYRTRMEQEHERARSAANERIARVHTELAERYAALLDAAIGAETQDDAP